MRLSHTALIVVLSVVLCLCLASCKLIVPATNGEQSTLSPTSATTPEQTTPAETTPEQTTPTLPNPDFSNLPDSEGTKRY